MFELLNVPEDEEWIYDYLTDYKLNLVHAGNVKPENFHTGLRQVFELLPFSGDAAKMQRYVEEHKGEFGNVTEETCELILTFFDDREMRLLKEKEQFQNREKGGYDMCTAFRQMREEGIKIGEARGEERGQERVNRLIQILFQEGRIDEIQRSVSDREYQEQLFIEYDI